MVIFEWVVGVLFGAVLLAALARRLGAPYPAFLALGGVGLAFVPGVPNLRLDPELALALFLAPVLLDAGFDASVRDMKENWRAVFGLAVGAVAVTTLAVAFVAHLIVPDMPIAACIVLGAVVAPPDAVAALAVLKHAPMPHRLATILRGESLLNDAASLIIYRLAVAAAMSDGFHPAEVAPAFLIGVVASLVAGPALGLAFVALTRRVTDPASTIVMQFVAAFGIWLAAEKLEMSGGADHRDLRGHGRPAGARNHGAAHPVISYAVWDTAVFVLNVLAFILIGIQIDPIQDRLTGADAWQAMFLAAAIFATVVVTRLAWVLPTTGLKGLGLRQAGERAKYGPGLALSWAGMRGIVTVAAALALPMEFPHRTSWCFTAFFTVLGTLIVQGLTLRPLLAHLKLEDDDPVGREVGWARAAAYKAPSTACRKPATSRRSIPCARNSARPSKRPRPMRRAWPPRACPRTRPAAARWRPPATRS